VSGSEDPDLGRRWFPICNRDDLQATHIFETELLGRELAVWRGSGGAVNVWANRCPHRGMRLTVGAILGGELRCAYHGYRYAEGSGWCTSIPAQPGRAPPRSLYASTYPVFEAANLVWTRLVGDESGGASPPAISKNSTSLYGLAVKSQPSDVGTLLARYRFRPSAALAQPETEDELCSTSQIDAYSFQSVARKGPMTTEVRLFLQPVDARCTVVHGILCGEIAAGLLIPALRHHAQQLTRLRDACERLFPAQEPPAAGTLGRAS
jgi:nitrite reductase/ring-hydroxylating ferredoxin subunit